jgi:hypothetical protein
MTPRRTADPSVVRRQSVATLDHSDGVQIVELPVPAARTARPLPEIRHLSQVLFETAGLLAESLDSGDARFKDEVIDLAVRSLRVAGTVIERRVESHPEQRHTI